MNRNYKKDEKGNSGNQPLFNSGVAFLERLHYLTMQIHGCFFDNDFEGAHRLIRCYEIEILPRVKKQEKDMLEVCRNNTELIYETYIRQLNRKTNLNYQGYRYKQNNPRLTSFRYRQELLSWFTLLSEVAHRLGLIMPDKPKESSALEV